MNLGVRAHDFGRLPAGDLAGRIAGHGFTCVQLAPPKAIAGFEPERENLTPHNARRICGEFRRHGIAIAVLGCYINLAGPDAALRRRELDRFKEYLRRAGDFGCALVGTETGSLNPNYSAHPGNRGEEAFQLVRAGVRELADEAERSGASVGIEGVERYVISDARRLRRLIEEVGSDRVRVIFDPVNLLSPENHADQDEIIRETFDLLGDRIAVIHAKDFVVEAGRLRSVRSGRGRLNHTLLAELIRARTPQVPVLLEDTEPATVDEGVRFWRELLPGEGGAC